MLLVEACHPALWWATLVRPGQARPDQAVPSWVPETCLPGLCVWGQHLLFQLHLSPALLSLVLQDLICSPSTHTLTGGPAFALLCGLGLGTPLSDLLMPVPKASSDLVRLGPT